MKKLLGIVVLGLIWCNISFANNTHTYLLKNELLVLYEGQNWKIQFMNNGKITSEFNGETTYDFSWKKINDNGTYEIYHSKFKKPNLWEINLNNNTFIETDLRGSNKKYTYQILKSQNNQSASNSNSSAGTGDKISLSLGLHDIPLINFAIKCNTVDYINTKMEWFWDRDSMTVTQFSRYGKKFIKAFKDAGFSKDQVKIAIEEGKEGLTHNITDWNSSKIIFTTKLSADYKFDGEEFEIMSNSLKYQEKCRLIEFKEQEQKTKKKKPIKRDKELDNLKKEADVMSRNAAACHINSTGNTRKLLGGHINYLYSLVQNSKLPGYDNEQMYRQIISASDTILKLGKCN